MRMFDERFVPLRAGWFLLHGESSAHGWLVDTADGGAMMVKHMLLRFAYFVEAVVVKLWSQYNMRHRPVLPSPW